MPSLRTLLAAAAATGATAACSTPAVAGANVTSYVCGSAGASGTIGFKVANPFSGAGQLTLGGTGLCFEVNGIVGDDGQPAVQVQTCDPAGANPAQLFAWLQPGPSGPSAIVSSLAGQCLDLESGTKAPGERLETFGCNGGPNQGYAWDGTSLTTQPWGYCIGVC